MGLLLLHVLREERGKQHVYLSLYCTHFDAYCYCTHGNALITAIRMSFIEGWGCWVLEHIFSLLVDVLIALSNRNFFSLSLFHPHPLSLVSQSPLFCLIVGYL